MNERAIFMAALEKGTPDQRSAYLDEACGGDTALRQRVEALLSSHEQAGSFLGKPVPERLAEHGANPRAEPSAPNLFGTVDEPSGERPGTVIGTYKLLQQIGEGGMGVVWMAEQTQPVQRKVALKVIKPGMDSRQVVARFEAERQALAMMDHVNIARVFDGGATEAGRPYFVMELVHGVPITKYCDDYRLTLGERLELFVQVCQAIQHAHQKGIIHRDIKPSNVMITLCDGKPVPKVIDFGVAKATEQKLTDRTLFTQYGMMVGTLEYMSPEQAEMSALGVDTRSDIYSLGVLLYELLTGTTPFDRERFKKADYEEIRRIIREEEPPRPSTRISTLGQLANTVSTRRKSDPRRLSQLCRGELDWIVMKTLEKDRNRRYETANGVAMDLQRYLADEPVLACPPSAWYRFQKFARRNRRALGTAAVLLIAAGLLAATISWAWRDRAGHREEADLRHAQTERDIGAALAEAEGCHDRLHKELCTPGGVFKLLNNAARWQVQIEQAKVALGHANAVTARAESPLAEELLGKMHALQLLLQKDEAERRLALALEQVRLERASGDNLRFDNAGAARKYLVVFKSADLNVLEGDVGAVSRSMQRFDIKEQLIAALDDWAFAVSASPGDPQRDKVWTRLLQVARHTDPGTWADQVRNPPWTVPALKKLAAEAPIAKLSPQMLVLVGEVLELNGQDAASWLRQAKFLHPADFWINLTLGNVLSENHAAEAAGYYHAALAVRENSAAYNNLGVVLDIQGKSGEAELAYRKAIHLQDDFAEAYNGLGTVLAKQKKFGEAEKHFQHAIKLKPDHAGTYFNLGVALSEQNELARAEPVYRKAIELHLKAVAFQRESLKGAIGDRSIARQEARIIKEQKAMAEAYYNLGNNFGKEKKYAAAETELRQAVHWNPEHASAYNNLGNALFEQGKLDEAEAAYAKGLKFKSNLATTRHGQGLIFLKQEKFAAAEAAFGQVIELDPQNADAHYHLGTALFKQKKLPAAEKALLEVVRIKVDHRTAYNDLGVVFGMQNKLAESAQALRKAVKINPLSAEVRQNLGNALHYLNELVEAEAEYHTAIKLNPDLADAYFNLGLVLMKQKRFTEAEKAFARAVQLLPHDAPAINNLANALVEQKKLAEAEKALRQAIHLEPKYPNPRLGLGQVLLEQGKFSDAALTFEEVLTWLPNRHPLYASAQRQLQDCRRLSALDKNLSAVLKGEIPDAKADERIELAAFCLQPYKRLYAASARLHQEAFLDNPALALDLEKGHRYNAARAAALAGCTEGKDDPAPDEAARARWRGQALDWLRADLAVCAKLLDGGRPEDRTRIRQRLDHWKRDADLAGLREATALAKLPPIEQTALHTFWTDVDALLRKVQNDITAVPSALLIGGKALQGTLTKDDPIDSFPITQKSHHQVHSVALEAGQPYLIDLQGKFDTFLRIENAQKKTLLSNDDVRPDDLNSRLVFIPPQKESYRLVVTSFKPGDTGPYTLSIDKVVKNGPPALFKDKLDTTDKDNKGRFFKTHKVQLSGGSPYTIELESLAFDTFLVLVDDAGKVLAENDDIAPGDTRRSRLDFTPKADGTFILVATSFDPRETGAYTLTVQRYGSVQDKK